MQKLVWKNADGTELNLTSGSYGITNWEGFSNTDLNLQTQKVPFQDGSVYLDSLLSERELSVTLAINDENDLYKRYQLRRELIKALNPKNGEGYLIYTNDYTSKRIKCVAQLPIFPTKNSNDSGTPKASLSWTACNPYWEDLEEIIISLQKGVRKEIENVGDIKVPFRLNLFTTFQKSPQLTFLNKNKNIKINGTYQTQIFVNTTNGEKQVSTYNYEYKKYISGSLDLNGICFSEKLQKIVIVADWGTIFCGTIEKELNLNFVNSNVEPVSHLSKPDLRSVTYSEEKNLFVACGDEGVIVTSPDGINWTERVNPEGTTDLKQVLFEENQFIIKTNNKTILQSVDGVTWEIVDVSGGYRGIQTVYSKNLNQYIQLRTYYPFSGQLFLSYDGNTWEQVYSSSTGWQLWSVTYSESKGLYVACGAYGIIVTSSDGVNWTEKKPPLRTDLNTVIYADELKLFVAGGGSGKIVTSSDGVNWTERVNPDNVMIKSIAYSGSLGLFVAIGMNFVGSYNGIDWFLIKTGSTSLNSIIYSEEKKLFVVACNSAIIRYSNDGVNWGSTSAGNKILNSVTYAKKIDLFCVVGYAGTIATSKDGIHWTTRSGGAGILKSVCFSEILGLFIAISSTSIFTSKDGINWISQESSYTLISVYCNQNSPIILIITNAGILESSDGKSWIIKEDSLPSRRQVIFSKELNKYVFVGPDCFISNSDFVDYENIINKLTPDSELNLKLEKGENLLLLTNEEGALTGTISYRQKYIGV